MSFLRKRFLLRIIIGKEDMYIRKKNPVQSSFVASAAASDQYRSMSTIRPRPESVSKVKISDEADPISSETIVLNLTDQIQNHEQIIEVLESPKSISVEQPELRVHSGKLKTEHQVFELPDSHPLLEEFEERVPDDPCPYLLVVWPTGDILFNEINIHPSTEGETIKGTILIPCQTATRGKFPVNESYFQINEVFADFESSEHPIDIPKAWISNLPTRSLHCGMTATTIFRGATAEEIQYCFSRGYICLRGFHRKQGVAKQLNARFHVSPCAAENIRGATL